MFCSIDCPTTFIGIKEVQRAFARGHGGSRTGLYNRRLCVEGDPPPVSCLWTPPLFLPSGSRIREGGPSSRQFPCEKNPKEKVTFSYILLLEFGPRPIQAWGRPLARWTPLLSGRPSHPRPPSAAGPGLGGNQKKAPRRGVSPTPPPSFGFYWEFPPPPASLFDFQTPRVVAMLTELFSSTNDIHLFSDGFADRKIKLLSGV